MATNKPTRAKTAQNPTPPTKQTRSGVDTGEAAAQVSEAAALALTANEIIEWEEITGDLFEEFYSPKAAVPIVAPDMQPLRDATGNVYMTAKPAPFTHLRAFTFLIMRRGNPNVTIEQAGEKNLQEIGDVIAGASPNPPKGSG